MVVLAGGRASRMGGNDKGLVKFNGTPLVRLIAEQISGQANNLLINANRNIEEYRRMGFQVVEDEMQDYQGPLAGILVGLKTCETDWLLTIPCDGPYVSSDYVEKMMHGIEDGRHQIAVASDGDRLQPVYALLHKDLIPSLTTYLKSGERKIDRWYAQEGYKEVTFPKQENMFTNVNTPEQLAALQDN